jgi:hypothetical protein
VCGCDGANTSACQCFFEEAETALCENVMQAGAIGLWDLKHPEDVMQHIEQAEPNVPFASKFAPSWEGAYRVDSELLQDSKFFSHLKPLIEADSVNVARQHICKRVRGKTGEDACNEAATKYLWCQKVEEGLVTAFGEKKVLENVINAHKSLGRPHEALFSDVLPKGSKSTEAYSAANGLTALGWMQAKDPAVQKLRRSFLTSMQTRDKMDALCDAADNKHVYDCKWKYADGMMCNLLEDAAKSMYPKKLRQMEESMLAQVQSPDSDGDYGIDWNYRTKMLTHFRVPMASKHRKSKATLDVMKQKMQDSEAFQAITKSSCEGIPRSHCKSSAKEALWCSLLAPELLKLKTPTEFVEQFDKRIPCMGELEPFGKGLGYMPTFGKMTC